MTNITISRYRFYREHKFLTFLLFELERMIAKSDFRNQSEINQIKESLLSLGAIMAGHAAFENRAIHTLLCNKGSTAHQAIEAEHENHDFKYNELQQMIDRIFANSNAIQREESGYQFYLQFRHFVSLHLSHFHQEETVIMPLLQQLYSDEQLRLVEFNTFNHMTPVQMTDMITVLSPHMNPSDRAFFIGELKTAEPLKWQETELYLQAME
jgi:hemerythrin-like domain-containing protein